MRRVILISLLTSNYAAAVHAQTPPMPLPPSVTGGATPLTPPPPPATPASASTPIARTVPIQRFLAVQNLPPDTVQCVLGLRSGADWMAKRQLAHGRFLFGVNPTLRSPLDGDTDFRQAVATWAMTVSAGFIGDDKLTACAGQAVLTLLAASQDDPSDAKVKLPTGSGSPLGYAAATALSVYHLPSADPKLFAEAEKLLEFVRKQVQPDGSFAGPETDPDRPIAIGLAVQALVHARRRQPDAAKTELISRVLAHYRAKFLTTPNPILAGTLIPAAVDFGLDTKDGVVAAMVFEMADWLCTVQAGRTEAKQLLWAGGFPPNPQQPTEPTFESAYAARGLSAACQLLRAGVSDPVRYAKYRPATVEALSFVRGLQATVESTGHFNPDFRTQYLVGGVRTALTDGNLRLDATAAAVLAFQRFLESGAELQ